MRSSSRWKVAEVASVQKEGMSSTLPTVSAMAGSSSTSRPCGKARSSARKLSISVSCGEFSAW
eukprot:scaffold68236_cov24-Tisochrysis_lutea.AAC.2